MALEMLARQRFLPDLEIETRTSQAVTYWDPLLENEQERMEKMISSMPPVCRAFVLNDMPPIEPEALMEDFLLIRHGRVRASLRLEAAASAPCRRHRGSALCRRPH